MADTDTPVVPETVTPGDSKTETTPVTAPVVDTSNADAKALAQKDMEINMLRNNLDKANKEKEAQTRKELEEKEEYRTLYEKEKAEREAILTERAEAEKKTQLEADSKDIFAKFNPDVVAVAESAGLSLEDTTEAAKTALTERLQAIAGKVKGPSVPGNNPAPTPDSPNLRSEEVLTSIKYGNKDARREYIKQSPSIQAVKKTLQEQVGYSQS